MLASYLYFLMYIVDHMLSYFTSRSSIISPTSLTGSGKCRTRLIPTLIRPLSWILPANHRGEQNMSFELTLSNNLDARNFTAPASFRQSHSLHAVLAEHVRCVCPCPSHQFVLKVLPNIVVYAGYLLYWARAQSLAVRCCGDQQREGQPFLGGLRPMTCSRLMKRWSPGYF